MKEEEEEEEKKKKKKKKKKKRSLGSDMGMLELISTRDCQDRCNGAHRPVR
jgi:hypothetical protein